MSNCSPPNLACDFVGIEEQVVYNKLMENMIEM
jgi:hypothetical protein